MEVRADASEWQGRRPAMEDRHVIKEIRLNDRTAILAAVLDGHGGSGSAEAVAAALRSEFGPRQAMNVEALKGWLLDVDLRLRTDGHNNDGTTLVAALLRRNDVVFVNVGDSRAVMFGPDGAVIYETTDHKPTHPVETARIKAAGSVVIDKRLNGMLAVSRALGDHAGKPRHPDPADALSWLPDILSVPTVEGAHVVLASDGLWDVVSSEEAAAAVVAGAGAFDLVRMAAERGSSDNVTVLLLGPRPADFSKPPQ